MGILILFLDLTFLISVNLNLYKFYRINLLSVYLSINSTSFLPLLRCGGWSVNDPATRTLFWCLFKKKNLLSVCSVGTLWSLYWITFSGILDTARIPDIIFFFFLEKRMGLSWLRFCIFGYQ